MKISYNWLKNYIKTDKTPDQLSEILTDTGLEVEGLEKFESIEGGLDGLVVGHVISKEKHPNADKLSVTKVDVGEEELLSIVCGAPNVDVDQKVIIATVGTWLYPLDGDKFKIKKSKIRGELSQGMICAEDEIGLGQSHDGIMILPNNTKIGTPAAEIFDVENDFIFEIGLTPNRSDAMSHIGVARDVAAALNVHYEEKYTYTTPKFDFPTKEDDLTIDVKVENTVACPRYAGLTITNIQVATSPTWLQNKLKAVGVRPINNVVDITNFVLKEYGQPLHAFDADAIKGKQVIVKNLAPATPFVTLDGDERKLHEEDLMICNAEEGMCMAGVFGGEKSGVTAKTTSIFLESAYFDSKTIRKTSTRHSLRTDAAARYEKGADPNIVLDALKRAASLICELAGGKIASDITDIYPTKIQDFEVTLRYSRLNSLAGIDFSKETVRNILADLEIKIIIEDEDVLTLNVPPYRADVQREADVIEEVMRIYGYNHIEIPSTVISTLSFTQGIDKNQWKETTAYRLNGMGVSEIMTNSISKSAHYTEEERKNLVTLQNSMTSELDIMRANLVYDGLEVLAYNINRKNTDLRLYEFGNIYNSDFSQEEKLVMYFTGNAAVANWNQKAAPSNFYHIKQAVNAVFQNLAIDKYEQVDTTNGTFDFGLDFVRNEKVLASFGVVKSEIATKFDIEQEVFYAVLDWDLLLKLKNRQKKKFAPIAKFPMVKRDLAMIVEEAVSFEAIKAVIKKSGGKLIQTVDLFDIYRNEEKIGANKKSYAVSFTLLHQEKTLTDKEIDKVFQKIMRTLEQEFDATIRK